MEEKLIIMYLKQITILLFFSIVLTSCQNGQESHKDAKIQELETKLQKQERDLLDKEKELEEKERKLKVKEEQLKSKTARQKEEDFDTFYKRFVSDENFHFRRISFPLLTIDNELDLDTEKMIETRKQLSKTEYGKIQFDQFVNDEKYYGSDRTISQLNRKNVIVDYAPETSYRAKYYFENTNGLWHLKKIGGSSG